MTLNPEHGAPVPTGVGLLQVRVLVHEPLPHDTEHVEQAVQALQLPSTVSRETNRTGHTRRFMPLLKILGSDFN